MPGMVRPRVVLVGPMGSGKSTVAALLAEQWGVAARDTDADIEHTVGKSVQEVFLDDGEPHFRDLEKAAVAAALADHDGVLALGGGAVMAAETRALLADHTVVHLRVGLSDAVQRVGLAESRPVLNQALGGVRATIKHLLDERGPLYEQVATVTVDTSGRTPEDVAAEITREVCDD